MVVQVYSMIIFSVLIPWFGESYENPVYMVYSIKPLIVYAFFFSSTDAS